MRTLTILAILGSFLCASAAHAQGGKLQRVREEVRAQPTTTASPATDNEESDTDCDAGVDLVDLLNWSADEEQEEEDDTEPVLGQMLLLAAASPFLIPCRLVGDRYEHDAYFVRYPYADSFPGSLWINRNRVVAREDPVKVWQVQLSIENGNDFDGLNRTNGRLLLDTSSRLGLQTSWNYFHEDLGICCDDLTLGDVNLVFRFAQNQVVQMRAGLGLRMLFDAAGSDYGVNFTYGADFTCSKPFVGSLLLDAGTVGSAGLFHARGTLGVLLHRWELFGGYDFFRIGTTNLQGPLAGLRLWF